MYVRNHMTANPYTIAPETSISDAVALMKNKGVKRLPVVKEGQLVGFLTHNQLLAVSPSPATSLSRHEVDYLLFKTSVESVMSKDVITTTPDTLLEEASLLLRNHDIGGLPVVEGDKLVGIITEQDIFDAFMEIMGFHDKGTRIELYCKDRPGEIAEVTGIIAGYGINITHIAAYRKELVVRVNTENVEEILKALGEKGYQVLSTQIKN